jgi:hypothetical protein
MNSRLAAKRRVYISTKKFIKSKNGGLEVWSPTKNIYCKKWLKIFKGSDSSSCTGGKKVLSKEILLVVNNGP